MNDQKEIEQLYDDMYVAMISKDETKLEDIHDESFVLFHMTGMSQSKKEYIQAIMYGTLNYYSSEIKSLDIKIRGNFAEAVGQSVVTAAVFGGAKHTWRLKLHFELKKTGGKWKFTSSRATTY